MKILVTGAAGYMGKYVIEDLLQDGHTVIATDIQPLSYGENVICEVSNIMDLKNCILDRHTDIDALIHLAWQDNFNHKSLNHLRNLPYHYEFLKKAIDHGCQNISVMGSMHEIGYYEGCVDEKVPCAPMSLYGVAKNALRQSLLLLDNDNVRIKWLRAYYIIGDDSRNNSIFAKILQWNNEGKKTFPFTSGMNKYDFLDIHDLAKQIVKAAEQNEIHGIINVCSGVPVSLKDKVEEFIRANHLTIRPAYGEFPDREYDSPAIWGDSTKIEIIMRK